MLIIVLGHASRAAATGLQAVPQLVQRVHSSCARVGVSLLNRLQAVATTNSTGGGSAAAAVKTPQQQPGTAIASKPVHVVQRCRAMKQGRKRVAQQEQQQQELQDATNLPKRIRLPEE